MYPDWSYGLSLQRWWSTQVITTWRKAPCQIRRLPRFRDLYGALRGYSEQMPIAYISVKPCPARICNIDNILRFNQMVQAFLQGQPATKYIDIYTAMLGPDHKPNPALFVQD
jgi:hypothetical protein